MRKIGVTIEMEIAGDGGECPSDAEMRMALAQVRAAISVRLQRQDFLSLDTTMTNLTVDVSEIRPPLAEAA